MAALLVEAGDCEFIGTCQDCGSHLLTIKPDGKFEDIALEWDMHVNTGQCKSPKGDDF